MQVVAWCASILVFLAFFMKTMIPLRIVAIGSNIIFISYGLLGIFKGIMEVLPILVLHLSMLPLNIIRLRQTQKLIKDIDSPSSQRDSIPALIPYMTRGKYKKGKILFKKGDRATKFFYIQKGTVEIVELEKQLKEGAVFGEVGIFGPGSVRSAGVVCTENCEIYSISKNQMLRLFFQNPKFGLFIVRMLANYAVDNVNKLLPPQELQKTQEPKDDD